MDAKTIFRLQFGVWLAGLPLFAFGLTDQAIAFSIGRFEPWLNITLCLIASAVAVLWLIMCPLLWLRLVKR